MKNTPAFRQALAQLAAERQHLRPHVAAVMSALNPRQANMTVPKFREEYKEAYLRETLFCLHRFLNDRFWIDGYRETARGAVYSGHVKGGVAVNITAIFNPGPITVELIGSTEVGGAVKLKVGPPDAKQSPDAFADTILTAMLRQGMI